MTVVNVPDPARPTISDVASLAGVSVPTVSKVLNNRPEVAEATRRRIDDAIAELGYTRRRSPRRRARAGLVDVVVRGVNSPWVQEVIAGAEEAAYRAGAGLVVTSTHGHNLRRGWLQSVLSRRSDGVVLVVSELPPEALDRLKATNIPVVLLDRTGNSDPDLPSIGAANWAGALGATEHLLALGHRRIGVISGDLRLACSGERIDGYLAALRRAGIPVDPDLIKPGEDFFPTGGRLGAAALLSLKDPPSAIFAASDLQALGVYEQAREVGLRLPEDLSVVGFDDLSLSQYITPPLTTVRQPHSEMAAEAVRMVLSMGRAEHPDPPTRIELATSLVVRGSTGPYLPGERR